MRRRAWLDQAWASTLGAAWGRPLAWRLLAAGAAAQAAGSAASASPGDVAVVASGEPPPARGSVRPLQRQAAEPASSARRADVTREDTDDGSLRRSLRFPRDHGAHLAQAIEWWYLTGWLAPADGTDPAWGFQLTFFRTPGPAPVGNTSRFAARQVVMAHAAVTELEAGAKASREAGRRPGRLHHDQRIARTGLGLASVSEGDTGVSLIGAGGPWHLLRSERDGLSLYQAAFDVATGGEPGAGRMALMLDLAACRLPLLQGEAGWSRKGPEPEQASLYVSEPQLALRGKLVQRGQTVAVTGRAWLDHEWSDHMLPPQAQGWDWLGINLFDGSALTLFRLRRQGRPTGPSTPGPSGSSSAQAAAAASARSDARPGASGEALWGGGSRRGATGLSRAFSPDEVVFEPLRRWISPTSAASYPVEWRLQTPVGRYVLRALADAQELDARASTGTVYWEGLAELLDATSGQRIGLGYLEMTGYAGRPAL